MIINLLRAGRFTAVHERRFVGHLCVAGEPALFERINECARLDPRRTRRPEPEPRVLQQPPCVPFTAVRDVSFGNRTIDLNSGRGHRQVVGRRRENQGLAVQFDLDARLSHGVAQGIPRFVHAQQFDTRSGPVGQFDPFRLVHVQVQRADDGRSRGRRIRRI